MQVCGKFKIAFLRGEEVYQKFNIQYNYLQKKVQGNKDPVIQVPYTSFDQLKVQSAENSHPQQLMFPWRYNNNSHLMQTTVEEGLELIRTET